MSKVPVSVIIAAYNEEKNIESCLRSVSWADEIIVVDGGSQDRTREIALRYTPQVMVTENAPAETQRLKGLKQVKNDWFFLLDADERVSAELATQIAGVLTAEDAPAPMRWDSRAAAKLEVSLPAAPGLPGEAGAVPARGFMPWAGGGEVEGSRPLTSGSRKTAYRVLRRNYYKNKPVHLHHPDYQLRLFRKSEAGSLPKEIHRIPEVKGGVGNLKGEIVHYFWTSVEDYIAKLNRYTKIEASYWKAAEKKVGGPKAFYYFVLRPKWRFIQYYFLKKGFLDGFFGFFFSFSSAYYEIIVAALVRADERD